MSFDPYYEWLGIPPDEQPADHYRLLGVRRFEANLNVIETAAERQMLLLKTRQNGPHSELTQQLMNEVSSSRICLLNARRKSEYDAKLRSRVDSQTAPVPPPHEMLSPALEERRELEPPRSQDPQQSAPSRRLRPANVSNTSRGFRHGKFARSVDLGSESIKLPLVLGGVAAIAVVLIMLWLFVGKDSPRPRSDVADRELVAESSIVAKLEWERQTTAPGSPRVVPNTQPPQPPVPLVPPEELQTSRLGQPGDSKSTDKQDTAGSAGQDSLGPELKPDVGGGRGVVNGSDAGDDRSSQQNQPLAPLDPRSGDEARVDDASTRDGPQLNGQHERIRLERSAGGLAPVNQPRARKDSVNTGDSHLNLSPLSSVGLATDFERLPSEFDLSKAIAATGPDSVCLGELPSFKGTDWQVLLEDYSSPTGKSKFSIGAVSTEGDLFRWPLFGLTSAKGSLPRAGLSAEETSDKTLLGHVEAGSTGLFLRFSRSASPELMEQFTSCGLTVQNERGEHHMQLQTPERIAPLTVAFDDAKKTVTLDQMPAANVLSPDRIALDILRVEMGEVEVPTRVGLRANLNKEITVTLNSELQCELGIRLSSRDGQFAIVVMPRYTVNGRRQPLVLTEIEKDLARSKTQLTRNQQDLMEAQNRLVLIVQEMNSVSKASPRSSQEEAALQVRLGQLDNMRAATQSKIRRLSEVCPKQASGGEQMEKVLALMNSAASSLVVRCRVIAQGETGDLILLQTTSRN